MEAEIEKRLSGSARVVDSLNEDGVRATLA